ncbi:MAG: carbohydrate ABC transporter permease [Clostridia bacterium]|nr:carbohydrate ABC transporter permease [Clostridia bacterium]MBR6185283.1 carbohydrate ABC transporter permease [Clostridia bacterium]
MHTSLPQKTLSAAPKRKKWTKGDYAVFIILTLTALLILMPFYNAVVISLETNRAYALHPVSLYPAEFSLKNYQYLIDKGQLSIGFQNTILITISGTVLSMAASVMMAYAFSRKFPGKKLLFLLMMFTMFFSGGMIPTYLQMKALKLIDSRWGIILFVGVSTYNIVILKSGFEQTPVDLEDAAKIDGANDLVIFFRVMLPLQGPLLATFTLFTAVAYWNEWFWSMLLINSSGKMTLQTVLRSIVAEAAAAADVSTGEADLDVFSQGVKMAAVMMAMVPIMCFYPFLQKYFVKGVMVGSVKM